MTKEALEQTNRERSAVRTAMLAAASEWSAMVEKAWSTDDRPGAYVGELVSKAFTDEAAKYKPLKEDPTDMRPLVDETPDLTEQGGWGEADVASAWSKAGGTAADFSTEPPSGSSTWNCVACNGTGSGFGGFACEECNGTGIIAVTKI